MKHHFCTLFNSYYLTRGIAMYESLQKYSKDFHLYVFAFDDYTFNILNEKKLPNTTIISLHEFEDERLLSVKSGRTIGEYCWTSTGSTIKYCIERFSLNSCTYLDADLYFFSDPKVLLDETKDERTLITEHRYTKKYDQTKSSGKYCVQFMTFYNNPQSMQALNWWVDACIDWCFARSENGKFGDQKYLDDWTTRFKNVHVLENLGGGVAPWNVQQYNFYKQDDSIIGVETKTNQSFDLVFFHFHALKELGNDQIDLSSYSLSQNVIDLIYTPYIQHLNRLNLDYHLIPSKNQTKQNYHRTLSYLFKRVLKEPSTVLRFFRKKIFEKNNIYTIEYFMTKEPK